jgi:hypothetical protein
MAAAADESTPPLIATAIFILLPIATQFRRGLVPFFANVKMPFLLKMTAYSQTSKHTANARERQVTEHSLNA